MSRTSVENPSGNQAMFLDILSSIVNRIKKLDKRLTKTDMANTTILQEMKGEREYEEETTKSILRDIKRDTRERAKDQDPVSSVATRHAAAT